MFYVLISEGRVAENIPDFSPDFPGVPVDERYPAAVLQRCVASEDEAPPGWYLNDNGSFTEEPLVPVLTELDLLKLAKLEELGEACTAAISAGVTIATSRGYEHFSLTLNDQANLSNLALQAQMGASVLYHADGELCRLFTPPRRC